jgi:putative ABC transport system substrate-binding protein
MYLELRRLGHIEGENLIVDRFSARGHAERLANVAKKIVKRKPEAILSESNVIARALAAATTAIPIVSWMGDPILFGLVTSLARPDGNITGVTVDAGWELITKQLQILKEAVPSASKIASMGLRANFMPGRPDIKFRREAERRLQIEVMDFWVNEPTRVEYHRVFADIARQKLDALSVGSAAEFFTDRRLLVELANQYRLPAIYWYPECVTDGGLMSYGPDITDLSRHVAGSPDPQRRQGERYPGVSSGEVSLLRQPESRQGAQPQRAAISPRSRRQGHRIGNRGHESKPAFPG